MKTLKPAVEPRQRYARGERPAVPEGGDIRVSTLGLAARLIEQQGGADGVLTTVDAALTSLVASWVDGAGLHSRVGDILITSRKDYERGRLGVAFQNALGGAANEVGLVVCRDSARISAVRTLTGLPDLATVDAIYTHVKTSRKSWQPKNVYASGIKNDARQQV